MLALNMIKAFGQVYFGRTALIIQKNSPQIMLVVGVTGAVVGTVLACKATLEVEAILEERKEELSKMDEVKAENGASEIEYTDEAYARDLAILDIRTGGKILKLYAPAILVSVISFGLITGGHRILTRRNAALSAAYKLIDEGFKKYRESVRKEYGDDVDRRFRFTEPDDGTVAQVTEDGTPPWEEDKKSPEENVPRGYSIYGREFSKELARQYQKSWELNEHFLRTQQNFVNDMLNARGHLFLNEVYDVLGLERSKEGAIVGWVKLRGHGDSKVDFRYVDPANERKHPSINQPWFLDFNVDGVIYDMI